MPRASRLIESRAVEVAASMREAYRAAWLATARGEPSADLWARLAERFGQAVVVSTLLGVANERRRLVRAGLVPVVREQPRIEKAPDVATFDDKPASLRLPKSFLDQLNVFRRDVPRLEERVNVLRWTAGNVARRMMERERGLVFDISARRVARVLVAPDGSESLRDVRGDIAADVLEELSGTPLDHRIVTETRTVMAEAFNTGSMDTIRENREVVPVTVLSEIHDRRTRGNPNGLYPEPHRHWQMDNFAAPSDDPVWRRIMPPNGWNCRAGVRGVSIAEARRNGWVPKDGIEPDRQALRRQFAAQWRLIESGQYPDPGFKSA